MYYSASGSLSRVFFKIRPTASGSGFSVLLKNVQVIIERLLQYSGYYSFRSVWFRIKRIIKNVQDIIQRLVQYPGYYSKYDLQHLVHYSGYYSKYDLQHLVHYSGYYSKYDLQRLVHFSGNIFKIRPTASGSGLRIIQTCPGNYSAPGS